MTDQPPPVDLDAVRTLIGDVKPATDSLIIELAQSIQERRAHEHPTHNEDWFCNNLSGWAGDRMAVVLQRLITADAEIARLRGALEEARQQTANARNQALAEGYSLIISRSGDLLDDIEEDDRDPSDWDRHQQWTDAASVLRAAQIPAVLPGA